MAQISLGDLANSYAMRARSSALKTEINRATSELASGTKDDLAKHLSGDFGALSAFQSTLSSNQTYIDMTKKAVFIFDQTQNALGFVQDTTLNFVDDLMLVSGDQFRLENNVIGQTAKASFDAIVQTMNVTVAGRSIFAGQNVDGPALADSDIILEQLRSAIGMVEGPEAIKQSIQNWFNGTEFDSNVYHGTSNNSVTVQIGPLEQVTQDIQANHKDIRTALAAMAQAVIASDEMLELSSDARSFLAQDAGTQLLALQENLSQTRAKIGVTQEKLDQNLSALTAKAYATQTAITSLIGADPYETATKLEETRFQLEALYTTISRNSKLSLMDYI